MLVSHGFQTNYERGFSNGLAAAGWEVTLIGSDRTDRAGLHPAVKVVNLRGSQEENRPRWAKALNLGRYYLALAAYAAWRRDAALHVIGLIEPPLTRGVLLGRWFRLVARRYVLTVHNILPHGGASARDQQRFRHAYRLPQACVVHTERTRDELVRDWGVPAERIVVMEHGIEPVSGDQALPAPRSGPLRLLFFGGVARYKGLDVLLEALQRWNGAFTLMIAGVCLDGAYQSQLSQQIGSHRGAAGIQWRNRYVREDEIAELFLDADAIVLPYRRIDQSGVLFQALRYGLPVVASRAGAFENYVTGEVGELCPPESVDGLAQALDRLLARRGELSRERIREIGRHHEWPEVVEVLDRAYE